MPSPISTWQFNFDWDIDTERQVQKSIAKLKECGLNFTDLKHHGISPEYFAEKVMTSGLVLNDKLTWICFHGNQDFGFLLKILMGENMPTNRDIFEQYLRHYFPNVLDIKSFMSSKFNFQGGLEKLAWSLDIVREGS
jgi:CCR4-NOT transcription complex subunit 7/8